MLAITLMLWLLWGIAGALLAQSKNRDASSWFVLCVLFGPFGLLAIIIMSPITSNLKLTDADDNVIERPRYVRTNNPNYVKVGFLGGSGIIIGVVLVALTIVFGARAFIYG